MTAHTNRTIRFHLLRANASLLAATVLLLLSREGYAATNDAAGFHQLDLRPATNMGWRDDTEGDGKGGWTDQGDNDMREVRPGETSFFGIPFTLVDPQRNHGTSVVTMRSQIFVTGPMSVTVPVAARAASIYFLHAAAWSGGEMATYTVAYADGSKIAIPIRDKQEICNWWDPDNGPAYRAAFHIANDKSDNVGMVVFGWSNPKPAMQISSIELTSLNVDGIVVVGGITLGDSPVSLPDPQDIPVPDCLRSDLTTLDAARWMAMESKPDPFLPSPIDQEASLDKPAGKHGWMRNAAGHFEFEDGTPAKLIAAGEGPWDPQTPEEGEYIARWLAKWGFNLVRFHHLVPTVIDHSFPDTQHLDAKVMDRLDRFIAQLAEHGIYVRFSMLYNRQVSQADGIDAFAQCLKAAQVPTEAPQMVDTLTKTIFDPKIMALNIALESAIMTHRNPYRNNRMYGEDPAVCQIEVCNEDSIFFYSTDGMPPYYRHELDRLWNDWLVKRYGSQEKLREAWGADLWQLEELEMGTVKRLPIGTFAAPIGPGQLPRASDQLRFYHAVNSGYFTATKDALRQAGVKTPICGSGWYGAGQAYWADLSSNAQDMDFVDRHHYWSGTGWGGWQVTTSPFKPETELTRPELLLKLGNERVLDKPYTISEWACQLPSQWVVSSAPAMALYGNALNGWDAPIHFQHTLGLWMGSTGFVPSVFFSWPVNSPETLCQYPILSRALRDGYIQRSAEPVYVHNVSQSAVFAAKEISGLPVSFQTSSVLTNAAERAASDEEALYSLYAGAVGTTGIRFTDKPEPDKRIDLSKYIDLAHKEIRSITGELYWNYGAGYFTVNAPRLQGAVGFTANVPITLADCDIRTDNPISSILVASWDGLPIKDSHHLLVSALARTRSSGMAYSIAGRRVLDMGKAPLLVETVSGTIVFKRAGHPTITPLDPWGYKTVDRGSHPVAAGVAIDLDPTAKAVYYQIDFP